MNGVHFLLTYRCTQACDHCFVFSSPAAPGTFSIAQIEDGLKQVKEVPSVGSVYFEGGEPFLFYPLLLESVRMARGMGFKVGIVSNGYFAETERDAELWLKPLKELGLADLSLSDDELHFPGYPDTPARRAAAAAKRMDLPLLTLNTRGTKLTDDGKAIASSGVMFRGRAAEKLAGGLPLRPASEMTKCPAENLEQPGRVHLDPYGNVHLCQGLCMGNIRERPFKELVRDYSAARHPIAGPLAKGGPLLLARERGVSHKAGYVSECNFCYLLRKELRGSFPYLLGPAQVYGEN